MNRSKSFLVLPDATSGADPHVYLWVLEHPLLSTRALYIYTGYWGRYLKRNSEHQGTQKAGGCFG